MPVIIVVVLCLYALLLLSFAALGLPIIICIWHIVRNNASSALPFAKYIYWLGGVNKGSRISGAILLIDCYAISGMFEDASHYAEEALVLIEKQSLWYRRLNKWNICKIKAVLAYSKLKMGEFQQANSLVDELLTLTNIPTYVYRTVVSYSLAACISLDRIADAQRFLHGLKAKKLRLPAIPHIIAYYQASIYFLQDRWEDALLTAAPSIALKSASIQIKTLMGSLSISCLTALGRLDEARVLLKNLPRANSEPSNIQAELVASRAELELASGELDLARELASQALLLKPDTRLLPNAKLVQAEVFFARGNRNMALQLCTEIESSHTITYYRKKAEALRLRITGENNNIEAAPDKAYLNAQDLPEENQQITRTSTS